MPRSSRKRGFPHDVSRKRKKESVETVHVKQPRCGSSQSDAKSAGRVLSLTSPRLLQTISQQSAPKACETLESQYSARAMLAALDQPILTHFGPGIHKWTVWEVFSDINLLSRSFRPSIGQNSAVDHAFQVDLDGAVAVYQRIDALGFRSRLRYSQYRMLEASVRGKESGETLCRALQLVAVDPGIYNYTLSRAEEKSLPKRACIPDMICQMMSLIFDGQGHWIAAARDVFTTWPAKYLSPLVQLLQKIITREIMQEASRKPQCSVICKGAVKALDLLWRANCACTDVRHALNEEEFYNEGVNAVVDMRAQAPLCSCCPRESNTFDFCAYPFLLDAASKAKILSTVTRHHKVLAAERRLIEQYRRGRRNDGGSSRMLAIRSTHPYIYVINVRRGHVAEDVMSMLRKAKSKKQRRVFAKELVVKFRGEDAVDQGGPAKEFFQLLMRELLSPEFGLFRYEQDDDRHWFCASDPRNTQIQGHYRAAGAAFGLAVYNGVLVDARFPRTLYEQLISSSKLPSQGIDQLEKGFPSLARGLRRLLDLDDASIRALELTFEASAPAAPAGEMRSFELVEGGADKPVTRANCKDYIAAYADWFLRLSVSGPMKAFKKGFFSTAWPPHTKNVSAMFTAKELEALLCGSSAFDFDALEASTRYEGFNTAQVAVEGDRKVLTSTHSSARRPPVVDWFWRCFRELPQNSKRRVLKFITGSDRAPLRGLAELNLRIQSGGTNTSNLPSAHTCFNTLILPEYGSFETLREKLIKAIEFEEGFGLS